MIATTDPRPETLVLAGRPVPRIVLGTSSLGSVLPDALVSAGARERGLRYLDEMLQLGCTALDIAASYQLGGTERLIGNWMHARKNRDRLFLITKGGHPYPVVQPHRLTPRALDDDLHASLRRLRTERVELYLLHRDDVDAPLEPIVATLAARQREGKIGAWGVSNWSHERIAVLDALARSSGTTVVASSPHFSLAEWNTPPWTGCVSIAGEGQRAARAFYARTQLPVLAWSPLGRGFFAGGEDAGIYGNAANLARRKRAADLALRYQVTPVQIALAYLFSQPFPVFAIVAASAGEKMRQNLQATHQRLGPDELQWLESGDGPAPFREAR